MLPVYPSPKLLSSRCLLRVFEQCTCLRVSMCGCCMVIYCVLIETVLTFTNSDLKNKQHTHTSGFNKQFWPRQQFAKLVKDKTNHGPSFTFSKKILLSGIYRKLIANSLRFSVRQQSSLLQITFVARGMSNISVFSIWNLSKCMSLEMATGGGGVAECDHTVVGRILHFFIIFGLISLNCFFFSSLEWIVNFSFQAP